MFNCSQFHAELMGKSIEDDSSSNMKRISSDPNKENDTEEVRNGEMDRNELLLDIALRTMVLLHHNQQLQNRLTALQMETRNFVKAYHNKSATNNSREPVGNWKSELYDTRVVIIFTLVQKGGMGYS